MSKNHISIDEILKHRRLTQNLNESSYIDKSVSEIKTIFGNTVKCNTESAFTRNYNQLIEKVSESGIADRTYNLPLIALDRTECKNGTKFVNQYIEMVVPRLDTDSLSNLADTIDQYTINDVLKEKIKKYVETYMIADRILNNHNNITERSDDIEHTILHSYRLGNHIVAEQVKDYIDTYNVRPYQKMNLCLEEIYYVLGKNKINYDKSAMVRAVVESFVLSKYNENKENYIKVLENNYCFTEEDVQNAVDVLQTKPAITGTIQSVIDEYINNGRIPILDLCINIGGCSISDIKLNIGTALDFIWRCIQSDQDFSFEDMQNAIKAMFETMAHKISISEDLMSLEDVEEIGAVIKEYVSTADSRSKSMFYTDDNEKFNSFINTVNLALEQFIKDCAYLYDRNNIDTIQRLNTEVVVVNTLQEFKKFRFNNLVRSAINLKKYIKAKAKSVFNLKGKDKSKLKLRELILKTDNGSSMVFTEDYGVEYYIGTDHKPDICVFQCYYNESDEYVLKEFFSNICKDFNKKFDHTIKNDNMKAYYIFHSGFAEIHLKENVYIELSEQEYDRIDRNVDPSMNVYIESLVTFANMSDKLIVLDKIGEYIEDQSTKITNEQFELLIEALSYLNVSKMDIEPFAEKYTELRYRILVAEGAVDSYQEEVSEVDRILESYEPCDQIVPIGIQLEALDIICDILEAGIKKPNIKKADIKKADASSKSDDYDEDDDEDEDDGEEKEEKKSPEEEAEEKKKIDAMFDPREEDKSGFGKKINTLRLALKGLRAKLGDLGGKYREAGKNMDAGVDHLLKGMHDALISNRREAIIKGSVIPSFSRCVNAGIILAGSGIASSLALSTIMPVVIGAVGAFIISKKLTKRERMLMLDELETELDVVEKEIQLAESKNQLKKYRALLNYKKNLQRQYQRIRYNSRIGKDILPNSATGVYKPGD